jgi:hypothetical protein
VRRHTGRVLALVALLVAIGGVGALALAGLGGSKQPARHAAASPKHAASARTHAITTKVKPAAPATTPAQSSTSTTPTPPAPLSAEQLQLTGHSELVAGHYPEAIATLRKAVLAADPSSTTYAYGLYDLGVALLKSGDAAGAVTILEQRLKIPNQTGVVQQTLDEALQASGQAPASGGGPKPGQGRGGGRGHHGHNSGGAGLGSPGQGGDEQPNFVD